MAVETRAAPRPINTVALAELLILGGTAVLLLAKWTRGQIPYYIHPRYTPLVVLAALILLLMAAVRARAVLSEPGGRPGWGYLLLAVPLLFGVLVPARPLGADTLAGRDAELNTVAASSGRAAQLARNTTAWNLLDWGTALSVQGDELIGKQADVVGFVFHGDAAEADAFFVVRYVVTCCAADGAGVGLPVVWTGGGGMPENSWVRVTGTIDRATVGGVEQPVLRAAAVEPVSQPESPYLYP